MSSSPTNPRPPARDVVDTTFAEIQSGPSSWDRFLDRHHKALLAGVLLLIAGVAAVLIWRWNVNRNAAQAAAEFSAAADVPELLAIADKHRGTPAAGTALLEAAQRTLAEDKPSDALPLLQRFVEENPKHPLRAEGLIGLAALQSQQGQDASATWTLLDPLVEKRPELGVIRAVHVGDQQFAAGNTQQATATWRSALDANPDAPETWRSLIDARLNFAAAAAVEEVASLPAPSEAPPQPAAGGLPDGVSGDSAQALLESLNSGSSAPAGSGSAFDLGAGADEADFSLLNPVAPAASTESNAEPDATSPGATPTTSAPASASSTATPATPAAATTQLDPQASLDGPAPTVPEPNSPAPTVPEPNLPAPTTPAPGVVPESVPAVIPADPQPVAPETPETAPADPAAPPEPAPQPAEVPPAEPLSPEIPTETAPLPAPDSPEPVPATVPEAPTETPAPATAPVPEAAPAEIPALPEVPPAAPTTAPAITPDAEPAQAPVPDAVPTPAPAPTPEPATNPETVPAPSSAPDSAPASA